MLDKHLILLFRTPQKHGQNFEQIYEYSTFQAIPHGIADVVYTESCFLIVCSEGIVYYTFEDKPRQLGVRRQPSQQARDCVSVAEAYLQEGILVLATFSRQSFCEILVCLNFEDAFQGRRDLEDQLPVGKTSLVSCFRSQLRDPFSNLFEVVASEAANRGRNILLQFRKTFGGMRPPLGQVWVQSGH